jgi:hypothetical protein
MRLSPGYMQNLYKVHGALKFDFLYKHTNNYWAKDDQYAKNELIYVFRSLESMLYMMILQIQCVEFGCTWNFEESDLICIDF